MRLSPEDHRRIRDAVASAEAKTSAEVLCFVTDEVSPYRETPLAWATAAALLLPALAFWLGLNPQVYLPGAAPWEVGHGDGAAASASQTLTAYVLSQAVVFGLVALLVLIPPVRRALTPGFLKTGRVHRQAVRLFAATGLPHMPNRTGLMIFASLKDRRVELVADQAVHDALGQAVWDAGVAAVVTGMKRGDPAGGFVDAIELCGQRLAEVFPPEGKRDNVFADDLTEV